MDQSGQDGCKGWKIKLSKIFKKSEGKRVPDLGRVQDE